MYLYITLKLVTSEVLKKWLGFIMVWGDSDEVSYSYGYNEER